jgi:serine/threonine-protein kinase
VNRVGRYEITEPLGQGGMGTVYKAYDPLLDRVVAVKIISAQFSTRPDLRDRFFREARAVARLDHPNIVTVYDLGEHEGTPYLAMQFLEGSDLEHRMKTEGLSLIRKVEIAMAVAAGLAHAHASGIVHRDVKPANVFITDDGQVKLLDFGLARLVTSELTRSNVMVGTINYMAPEQLRGAKTDLRADIFSFGVVLYELLGGKKPFQAESFAAVMYKILEEPPEPLEHLDPQLPPRLIAIVDRAMAKAKEDRYQLMFEVLRDLEAAYEPIRAADPYVGPPLEGGVRASTQVKAKSNPPITLIDPNAPTVVGTLPGVTPTPRTPAPRTPTPRTPAPGTPAPMTPAPDTPAPATPTPLQGPTASTPTTAPGASRMRKPIIAAAGIAALVLAGVVWRVSVRPTVTETPALTAPPAASAPVAAPTTTASSPAVPPAPPVAPVAPSLKPAPGVAVPTQMPTPSAHDVDDTMQTAGRMRAEEERAKRAADSMRVAKVAAVAADAATLAPQLYAAAESQEKSGLQANQRGHFAIASARLQAATSLYSEAETSARAEQEARADRTREAETAQRAREAAAAATKAEAQRAAEVPAPAPAPAPPTTEPPPAPVVDEARAAHDGALATLRRYTSALEHRDMAALKSVWPGLDGREQSAIESEFNNARSITVTFVNPKVDVSGPSATVTGLRQYSLQTRDGQDLRSQTRTTLLLKRAGNEWLIDSVRHQPAR